MQAVRGACKCLAQRPTGKHLRGQGLNAGSARLRLVPFSAVVAVWRLGAKLHCVAFASECTKDCLMSGARTLARNGRSRIFVLRRHR